MSLTAAGIGKAVTSGIAGGSALILAAAAAMGEIPMPGSETLTHSILGIAMIYIAVRDRINGKSEPVATNASVTTNPPQDWPSALLGKLDDIDKKLDAHLIAFARFDQGTDGRIKLLEYQMSEKEK